MTVTEIVERLVRRVPPHSREDLDTEIEVLRENERLSVQVDKEFEQLKASVAQLRTDVDALKAAKG